MKDLFLLRFFRPNDEEIKMLISYQFKKMFKVYHYNNDEAPIIVNYGISNIVINKLNNNEFEIKIFLSRPGMLIGKSGNNIDSIKNFVLPGIKEEVQLRLQRNIKLEIKLQVINPFDYKYELNYLKNKKYKNTKIFIDGK